MGIPLFIVDAFTDQPFSGNPAAVCILENKRDDAWMQAVAAEMNLSNTAFIQGQGERYQLRWFTPTTEVDLCGHATLASAHVLWQIGTAGDARYLTFETRSGTLTANRLPNGVQLDFPKLPVHATEPPPVLAEALGVPAVFVGRTPFDWLVEIADQDQLRQLTPNLDLLAQAGPRGVIITCPAARPGVDFLSRFFAPAAGIPEDPVTGSAHCALAPYWSEKLGKNELIGYQASARGGQVTVHLVGDRVRLDGQAVTIARGTLEV